MSKHVLVTAAWTGTGLRFAHKQDYRDQVTAMKLRAGEEVVIRIERPEDAVRYGQYKYLFGVVFRSAADVSGHTEQELCLMAKAKYMPKGKSSLTQLSKDEMDLFTKASEQWLREELPDAFVLYDRGAA